MFTLKYPYQHQKSTFVWAVFPEIMVLLERSLTGQEGKTSRDQRVRREHIWYTWHMVKLFKSGETGE